MMRHVSSCGPSMYMGIPSLPNSRSHTPSHSPRCPAAFEVRVRLEPEPASVPDRAEHDPLGENQRHLYRCPRITAEGISTKRRELPPLDRLRPQGVLHP